MDWTEIFKQISSSVKLSLTVLLTSGALVFFKEMNYSLIQSIPKEWIGLITIVFIFSAIFFSLSIIFLLGNSIINFFKNVKNKISEISLPINYKSLNELQTILMIILASLADKSYDLRKLDHDLKKWNRLNHVENKIPSKLEILSASKSLSKKGLIKINYMDENLIYLTDKGRDIALKMMTNFEKENQP